MTKKKILFLAAMIIGFQAMAQHQLPKLEYGFGELEPYIDSTTMSIHYGKHHAAYVNTLNEALKKYPDLQKLSIEDLMKTVGTTAAAVRNDIRNAGGGHYNHTFFWSIMTTPEKSKMSKSLNDSIVARFGSIDKLKQAFEQAAMSRFGSGWAWLVKDETGKLRVFSTANQDSPIMDVLKMGKVKPILCLDVWEHAYYLKYQNRRAEYVKNFWNVVNWDKVEKLINEK